jgi:hypothetical protein
MPPSDRLRLGFFHARILRDCRDSWFGGVQRFQVAKYLERKHRRLQDGRAHRCGNRGREFIFFQWQRWRLPGFAVCIRFGQCDKGIGERKADVDRNRCKRDGLCGRTELDKNEM